MNCDLHPGAEVVGRCVSCDRKVCMKCLVEINGLVHCRDCVDAGKVKNRHDSQPSYVPVIRPVVHEPPDDPPKPRGEIRAIYFQVGAVGALLSGIPSLFLFTSLGESNWFYLDYFYAVGLILIAFGCYGIFWDYGCFWGIIGLSFLPTMGISLALGISSTNGFIFLFVALITTPFVLHLSTSHMRRHLPKQSNLSKLLQINRAIVYLGGGLLVLFLAETALLSGYAFYSVEIILLMMQFSILLTHIFFFFFLSRVAQSVQDHHNN